MPTITPKELLKKPKHAGTSLQRLEKAHNDINSVLKKNFDGYVSNIPAQELLSYIPNTTTINDILDDYIEAGWNIRYLNDTNMYRFSLYNYT